MAPSRHERFATFERRYAAVSRVLDDLVAIPGTNQRVGLDPVIGLIPWIGDLNLRRGGVLAHRGGGALQIPGLSLARMVFNTLVDLAVGAIPVLGDLFDVVSRSNKRNLELFRRHATDAYASTAEHRAFLAGLALVVKAVLWLLATFVGWLLSIEIPTP